MTTIHKSPQIFIGTSTVNTAHLNDLSDTSDTSDTSDEESYKSINTSNLSDTSDEQLMFSCTDMHNDFYKKKANKYKCKYEALVKTKINNDITSVQ